MCVRVCEHKRPNHQNLKKKKVISGSRVNRGNATRKGRGETVIETITEKDIWDLFKEAPKQAEITGLKDKLLRE